MTFGLFARHKRQTSNHTIVTVAAALGIKSDACLKKETGKRQWSLDDIMALAKLYEVKASELLAEWEKMQTVCIK